MANNRAFKIISPERLQSRLTVDWTLLLLVSKRWKRWVTKGEWNLHIDTQSEIFCRGIQAETCSILILMLFTTQAVLHIPTRILWYIGRNFKNFDKIFRQMRYPFGMVYWTHSRSSSLFCRLWSWTEYVPYNRYKCVRVSWNWCPTNCSQQTFWQLFFTRSTFSAFDERESRFSQTEGGKEEVWKVEHWKWRRWRWWSPK